MFITFTLKVASSCAVERTRLLSTAVLQRVREMRPRSAPCCQRVRPAVGLRKKRKRKQRWPVQDWSGRGANRVQVA